MNKDVMLTMSSSEPVTIRGKTPTPQRCTRGHTWDVGSELVGIALDLSVWGLTGGREEYCLLCFRDLLREHCGRVKPA